MELTPATMQTPLFPAPGLRLSQSHKEILHHIVTYRYLTPRLLAVAYGHGEREGRGLKHIRHELPRLHAAGYVARFNPSRQLVGFSNEELVYTATLKGARAVLDDETYEERRRQIFARSRRPKTNYQHQLGVSALQLILSLGAKPQGFQVVQFLPERDTAAVEIPAYDADGRRTRFYPDATAIFRFPATGQETLYLFEFDLAPKNTARLARRFQAYQTYLTTRADELRRRYRVNGVVVVFIGPTHDDVVGLLRLAQQTLQASRRARPLFLFWNAEDWWTSVELRRRQKRTDPEERRWTVRVLRDPADILAEEALGSLGVPARKLVQSTA